MKEEASSSASWRAKRNLTAETSSDSFDDCNFKNFPASKRLKHHEHNNASNKSVLMMKFKGVVPQQNGHWGAQIYANHRRIWLGTFKSEKEAAMAYDSATIKLRSRDSHRNFPWTDRTIQEPSFQRQYSTEGILHMIRDGSYQLQFAEFLRAQTQREEHATSPNDDETRVHGERRFSCIQLFQKELTPSDVGKLNRLVFPKKFAVKYFPYFPENGEDDAVLGGGVVVVNDIELSFYDRMMKLWRFRYCYWRSSQSFVFTRGWNRFVKEKNLKEKDIVTFYTCGVKEGQQFALIDITYSNGTPPSCVVDEVSQIEEKQKELELNLGCKFRRNDDDKKLMIDEDKVLMRGMEYKDNVVNEKGIVRLFGVQIK